MNNIAHNAYNNNTSDNIFMTIPKTKEQIKNSNECSEQIKKALYDIIKISTDNRQNNNESNHNILQILDNTFSKNIISFPGGIPMDKTDVIVVRQYYNKAHILEIYKYINNLNREYWLVMDDVYSSEAMQYYDEYFSIINDSADTFCIRIINQQDLIGLLYLNPIKLG